MTPEEERDLAEATRRYREHQTDQLSAIIRGHADVMGELSEVKGLAWETRTDVAALVQRVGDHDRRLGLVETWQDDKDEQVTATGRHDVARLDRQLEAMAERRRGWVKVAVAAAITLTTGGILTWAGIAIAGCV